MSYFMILLVFNIFVFWRLVFDLNYFFYLVVLLIIVNFVTGLT